MFDDHERFLNKNKSLAQGYEIAATQDKVAARLGDRTPTERPPSCFTCKRKQRCHEFQSKYSGGNSGVVSIDSSTTYLCDKYDPMPPPNKEKPMTGKAIKNIMKAAKLGRL